MIGTFTITCLLFWPAKALAEALGLMDHPDDRKDHDHATPYGGGILLILSSAVAAILFVVGPLISPELTMAFVFTGLKRIS